MCQSKVVMVDVEGQTILRNPLEWWLKEGGDPNANIQACKERTCTSSHSIQCQAQQTVHPDTIKCKHCGTSLYDFCNAGVNVYRSAGYMERNWVMATKPQANKKTWLSQYSDDAVALQRIYNNTYLATITSEGQAIGYLQNMPDSTHPACIRKKANLQDLILYNPKMAYCEFTLNKSLATK